MKNLSNANLCSKPFRQTRTFTLRCRSRMRVIPLLVRILAVLTICTSLILPGPFMKHGKASADIVSDLKTGAAQYAQAMREINVITTMPLSTRQDVQRAVDILKKNDPLIRVGIYKRMALVAMSNATLKQSVESQAARLGAKVLLARVLRDRRSVWNFEGSQAAADSIRRQLRADADIMSRAGKRLKEAITKLNRTATVPERLASSLNLDAEDFHHSHQPPEAPIPPQGWEEVIIGALVVAVVAIITAWGIAKSQDFQEPQNPAPGVETRSDFKVCIDRAYERRETCLKENDGKFWEQSGCWAVYSIDMSLCILLPQ